MMLTGVGDMSAMSVGPGWNSCVWGKVPVWLCIAMVDSRCRWRNQSTRGTASGNFMSVAERGCGGGTA